MKLQIFILSKIYIAIFFMLLSACSSTGQSTDVNDLIRIIEAEQKKEVKESFGQGACCCFTWNDLDLFKQRAIPQVVATRVSKRTNFQNVINSVRSLSDTEWIALRRKALSTRRPTWAEQGNVSGSGQTDAGAQAERLIAEAIVARVEESMK